MTTLPFSLRKIAGVLLLCFCLSLVPKLATAEQQIAHTDSTGMIDDSPPPGGEFVRHNEYGQITGIWRCGLYEPIPTICMYEDVFPVPPPPNAPPPFPTAKWHCFLDPVRTAPLYAPWRRGYCTWYDSTQTPNGEVYSITDADYRPQKKLSKEQKDILLQVSDKSTIVATVSGGAAAYCAIAPEVVVSKSCAVLGGTVAIVSGVSAVLIGALARDPSDPNFRSIIQPVTKAFPDQPFSEELTVEQSTAINALLENQLQMIGLLDATLVSLDRAQGAYDAGDVYWEERQMQSAQKFINQASVLLRFQPNLYADLHRSLDANNPFTQTLTITDVVNFQQMLVTDDIPWFTQYSTDLGLDSLTQASIRQGIASIDASKIMSVSNGSYLELIVDPSITTTLQAGSEVFSTGFMSVTWSVNLPLLER